MGGVLRWNDVSELPADLGPTAVTLGNFDGVHRGHRAVLEELVNRARRGHLTSVAVTFDPHPLAVLRPDAAPPMLCSVDKRLELVASTGVVGVLVLPFTREFAAWSPEEFVERIFARALGARCVVVGEDTRFGHRNSGNVSTLRELGAQHGFEVVAVADLGEGEESDEESRWSSSMARAHLAEGDVAGAERVLGRLHVVSGEVVHGDHRGRELGYPTANLSPDSEGLVPTDGVYAGWLVRPSLPQDHPDRRMPASISIGTNPTFEGTERRVEAYVLDRTDLDLYGEEVAVEFVSMLRPTLKFDSVDELLVRMATDVDNTRAVLAQRAGKASARTKTQTETGP